MPLVPPSTSVRELDDDSIALLLEAYAEQIKAVHPNLLCGAPFGALCVALYGPGRCGPGDADADRRIWKHFIVGYADVPLPAPYTTWRGMFESSCVTERDVYGRTMLVWASQFGHAALVRSLLARGADVNEVTDIGWTALLLASRRGHIDVVEALLPAVAVDTPGMHGNTALMEASKKGHLAVVELLLAAGAVVGVRNVANDTALMFASEQGHADVARRLLAAGADVNARDSLNRTALMFATYGTRVEVVQVLVAAGADVNAANANGFTPLMNASGDGNVAMVEALLAAGADVNALDDDDVEVASTALGWARTFNRGDRAGVVRVLLAAGATE